MGKASKRVREGYGDLLAFLAAVENPKEKRMNKRTPLSVHEISKLRRQHPGIPEDYLDYLQQVGWGSFRECQFMVYGEPITPQQLFGDRIAGGTPQGQRVLLLGDDFSETFSGFLPDEDWRIVTSTRGTGTPRRAGKRFAKYIREAMLMGPSGRDLRA